MSRNKKGKYLHIPRTIITKFVAMPYFPSYEGGKRLMPVTFEVNKEKELDPELTTKEAIAKAFKKCAEYAETQSHAFWVMTKGIKTSQRVLVK